ncbi:NADP-dependent oxidoreductase [Streptomyces sp. NBC_00654]|uniref:NADP-dependent oxidoreductase n=1 Tax=Streptomyces sp. NBC_00654 TaxID=2975799 RepID=UPI0022501FCF|nr:NADP-dependent oxidoreductase [Streptomyces sp. NBC_00654]MCX4963869.1 NADP-dependent oxidoreductase [Streptomyces sp. NBC_00654]
MEAIVYEEFGGPDVLRLARVDEVRPGPGQLRVKVRAAGVNPIDYKIRHGWMEQVFPTPLPATPGTEFAGVVEETGEGVTAFAPGDEVLGWSATGAYATHALAEAAALARKPEGLAWDEAAALPVATETASRVLDELEVAEGDTLLLHGAAGAVGSAAVQLAAARGATVIGTASPANHDYLRVLGAVPVAYGDGLVARVRELAPQGVDAVFDASGRGALPDSIELRGGTTDRIVTIADPDAGKLGVAFSAGGGGPSAERLARNARRAALGELRVPVARTLPLAEARTAHELSEAGHVRGKLVLLPPED